MSGPGQHESFAALGARARRAICLEALARIAAGAAVFLLVSYGLDRTLRLEWPFRLVFLGIFLWWVVRVLMRDLYRPLTVELNDDELALAVERRDPGLRQELISAVQFERALLAGAPGDTVESPELMGRVVSHVKERLSAIPFHRALERGRITRFAALLLVSLAVPATFLAADSAGFGLWARRALLLSPVEWPRYTQFEWTEVSRRIPEGENLTVRVAVDGPVPDQVFLEYAFAGGEDGVDSMTGTGEQEFSFTLETVLEDVGLQVYGGDGLSETLTVEVVERPRIEDLALTVEYPGYMEKAPREIRDLEGDVRVPAGAVLDFEARSHKPLREAFLLIGQGEKHPLDLGADRHAFTGRWEPEESVLLTVDVIDADRLGSGHPPRVYLRLAPDEPPDVDFRTEGIGSLITAYALIPGTLEVRDDYGLRSLEAEFQITSRLTEEGGEDGGGARSEDAWEPADVAGLETFADNSTLFEARAVFDLQPLNASEDEDDPDNRVRPGHLVSLRFGAVDNFGPGEPHTAHGEVLTFRVVTRAKLVEELMRRQFEQKRDLREILAEEREDLAVLEEILSPAVDDPRAGQARARLRSISRAQKALGRRVRFVADRYDVILMEYRNNRIWAPNKSQELRELIVVPLEELAEEDFPTSARDVQRFAASGDEDVRQSAVSAYRSIAERLAAVIERMEEAETLAALIEELRGVIKLEESAIERAEKRRDELEKALLGPGRDKQPDEDEPDKNEK